MKTLAVLVTVTLLIPASSADLHLAALATEPAPLEFYQDHPFYSFSFADSGLHHNEDRENLEASSTSRDHDFLKEPQSSSSSLTPTASLIDSEGRPAAHLPYHQYHQFDNADFYSNTNPFAPQSFLQVHHSLPSAPSASAVGASPQLQSFSYDHTETPQPPPLRGPKTVANSDVTASVAKPIIDHGFRPIPNPAYSTVAEPVRDSVIKEIDVSSLKFKGQSKFKPHHISDTWYKQYGDVSAYKSAHQQYKKHKFSSGSGVSGFDDSATYTYHKHPEKTTPTSYKTKPYYYVKPSSTVPKASSSSLYPSVKRNRASSGGKSLHKHYKQYHHKPHQVKSLHSLGGRPRVQMTRLRSRRPRRYRSHKAIYL